MDVVVEPAESHQWVRRFAVPGMTYCLLRAEGPAEEVTGSNGDELGDLATFLRGLVRGADPEGRAWVARVDAPEDEVEHVLELTGRSAHTEPSRGAGAPPRRQKLSPSTVTLVLSAQDPAVSELVTSGAPHGTVALLHVADSDVDAVLGALARHDDGAALAAADLTVLVEPALHSSTVAIPAHPGRTLIRPLDLAAVPSEALAPPARALPLARPAPAPLRPNLPTTLALTAAFAAVAGAVTAVALHSRERPTPTGATLVAPVVPRASAPAATVAPRTAPPSAPAASAPPSSLPTPAPSLIAGPQPPARGGALFVFDPIRDNVVLFGGTSTASPGHILGDTWTWDGATWTERHPPFSPPPRTNAAITFDPAIKETVVFGGNSARGSPLDDTWLWDGSVWKELLPTRSRPPAGVPYGLAFDEARQGLVLLTVPAAGQVGAQTWTWAGTTWGLSNAAAAPTVSGRTAMAYDPVLQRVILVDAGAQGTATWIWDGAAWTRQADAGDLSLDPAAATTLTYDPATQALLLVEAAAGPRNDSDVWTYDGRWQHRAVVDAPAVLAGSVSNVPGGPAMVFGGPSSDEDLGQQWSYEPPRPLLIGSPS